MKEKYYLQSDIAEITKNLEKHLKYFSGKKFLISGANGFLGKAVCDKIKELNRKMLHCAKNLQFEEAAILRDEISKLQGE